MRCKQGQTTKIKRFRVFFLFLDPWLHFKWPGSRPAMSNPNVLLVQKSCRYLNQGRTFDDILMRAAHWMTSICAKQI